MCANPERRFRRGKASRPARLAAAPPLATYLHEINATPLLTAEEEKQLAYRIEEGDCEARDHLARANLRLVVAIARGYRQKGLSLEDLIAEGNLGLMRAVVGFDPRRNTRFSTYAVYWIKQSIKRAIVNTAKVIRLPNYVAELVIKYRRATARLHFELGRAPTPEEIARRLGLSSRQLKIILHAVHIRNLALQTSDTGRDITEVCRDASAAPPDARLEEADNVHQLFQMVSDLDTRQAAVLRLRFGLNGEQPKTLNQIGTDLGLTRERVRQIEREALGKLRESLDAV